ncbi:MAG: hypothetical protein V4604_09875 [Bacteroidota bacterium]
MKNIPHIPNLFVLAFMVLLISVSCKDKDPKPGGPCTTCQSVTEAKDYFYFKMGSFWVYEEETTHERDSMYVTASANDIDSYNFDVSIKSALTDYEYHYWPVYNQVSNSCSPTAPVAKRCLYVMRGKGKFQDNLGESSVFFIRYRIGEQMNTGSDMTYCPNNKITLGAILDSLVLPDYTFQKTIRIDEDCSFQEGKQPTRFYYTQGVGIVRKELIDSNQVWNLVDYYIAP